VIPNLAGYIVKVITWLITSEVKIGDYVTDFCKITSCLDVMLDSTKAVTSGATDTPLEPLRHFCIVLCEYDAQ
jgi:hypothetical protein